MNISRLKKDGKKKKEFAQDFFGFSFKEVLEFFIFFFLDSVFTLLPSVSVSLLHSWKRAMIRQYLRSTHLRWSRCHSWTSCSTTSAVPRRSLDLKWAPSASSAKTVYWANGDFFCFVLFCSNSIYLFSQKKNKNHWKKNRTILFVKKKKYICFQKAANQGENAMKFNMNRGKKRTLNLSVPSSSHASFETGCHTPSSFMSSRLIFTFIFWFFFFPFT